jgi:hypothetical protein
MEGFLRDSAEAENLLRSAKSALRVWQESGGDAEEMQKTRRLLGRLAEQASLAHYWGQKKKKKKKKKKKSTKKQLDNLEHTILELELDGRVDTTRCRAKFVELSNERRALVSALQIEPPKRREIAVNLTVQEARTLQKVSEREQDALLEGKRSRSLFCSFFPGLFSDLGGSLQRQQHIGLQIGKTVEEQQPLIDRVAARTGRSDAKVQREIQRIEEFEVGKCSIVAWIVVFFLAAVLIVLLATDGGCKILFSSSYCANRPWLSRPNATS